MALKELQEKYRTLMSESATIAAKADLSDTDCVRLEEIVAEGTKLQKSIEAVKKAEGIADWGGKAAGMLPMATVHGLADSGEEVVIEDKGSKIYVNSSGGMIMPEAQIKTMRSKAYKAAFVDYLRHAGDKAAMSDSSLKALQEGNDTAGGYLVTDDILNRLISKEPTPTVMAGRVTKLTTSKDVLVIPKVTYTTDNQYTTPMRVTWGGEIPASATGARVTDPTFGQVRIPIWTATMSIPLSQDFIEDSSFDIVAWVGDKFEETINLLYENLIINGTGANQPMGILNNANVTTVNSLAAATLTADGIVDLVFNLPPQYDQGAVMVMNKTSTARTLYKLKDGDGRYMWGTGTNESGLAMPAVNKQSILGYPVLYTEFMPNATTGLVPIIFGDLKGYYLVNRVGLSVRVLQELYAETNQILVLGRLRFGGDVVEDYRLRTQTVSA